jgi:hypothetical protein
MFLIQVRILPIYGWDGVRTILCLSDDDLLSVDDRRLCMRTSVLLASFVLLYASHTAGAQSPWDPPAEVGKIGVYACRSHPEIQATWPARCPICRTVLSVMRPVAVAGAAVGATQGGAAQPMGGITGTFDRGGVTRFAPGRAFGTRDQDGFRGGEFREQRFGQRVPNEEFRERQFGQQAFPNEEFGEQFPNEGLGEGRFGERGFRDRGFGDRFRGREFGREFPDQEFGNQGFFAPQEVFPRDEFGRPLSPEEFRERQFREFPNREFGDEFAEPGFGNEFMEPGFGNEFTEPGFGDEFTRPGFGDEFTRPGIGNEFTRPGFGDEFTRPGFGDEFTRPGFGDEGFGGE